MIMNFKYLPSALMHSMAVTVIRLTRRACIISYIVPTYKDYYKA